MTDSEYYDESATGLNLPLAFFAGIDPSHSWPANHRLEKAVRDCVVAIEKAQHSLSNAARHAQNLELAAKKGNKKK